MKIVYTKVKKQDKKGNEKTFINFYVQLENGVCVPIEHKTYLDKEGNVKYSSYRDLLLVGVDITNTMKDL